MPIRVAVTAWCCFAANHGSAADPDMGPRRTATVVAAEAAVPAVATLYAPKRNEPSRLRVAGSAAVLDDRGYMLTAAHLFGSEVVPRGIAIFDGLSRRDFALWHRLEEKDLAIARVGVSESEPLQSLTLGRSDDLMLGEPLLAIGNPGGNGLTLSQGILSGKDRRITIDDAVTEGSIQFTAAVNPGNSGGPIVNALGQQIGVVLQRNPEAEAIGYGIAADSIRKRMRRLIRPEFKSDLDLGLRLDPLIDPPTIASVEPDGPAAAAGLKPGDVIEVFDERTLNQSHELLISWSELSGDGPITGRHRRGDDVREFEITPVPTAAWPAETVNRDDLLPGLSYVAFEVDELANDATLRTAFGPSRSAEDAVDRGRVRNLTVDGTQPREDRFAIRFEGYLDVPAESEWNLAMLSDDGSRMMIDDREVIVIDGDHPAIAESVELKLAAGLHRIAIEYFDYEGRETLQVRWRSKYTEPYEIIPSSAWQCHPQ